MHDCRMPNYRWRCLACGETNDAVAAACVTCSCPAFASVPQIQAARDFVASRGMVAREGTAADSESELTAFDVLVRPALFLLTGWLPRR